MGGVTLVLLLCGVASRSQSGEGLTRHCERCGETGAKFTCRRVVEEKKVTVTCWGCQDENFCVPGPSREVCEHAEEVCDDCDPAGKVSYVAKLFSWREWCPKGSPTVYTKRKLMKRTVTKTVPSEKWVVECLCDGCCAPDRP